MYGDWQDLSFSAEPWGRISPAIEHLEPRSTTLSFLAGDEYPVKCRHGRFYPAHSALTVP